MRNPFRSARSGFFSPPAPFGPTVDDILAKTRGQRRRHGVARSMRMTAAWSRSIVCRCDCSKRPNLMRQDSRSMRGDRPAFDGTTVGHQPVRVVRSPRASRLHGRRAQEHATSRLVVDTIQGITVGAVGTKSERRRSHRKLTRRTECAALYLEPNCARCQSRRRD